MKSSHRCVLLNPIFNVVYYIMNYYVDYENVVCSGLVGIDKLTSNDTVNIYYSNDPNVDMETVIRIRNSKANIVFLKLCNSIKQMNRSNESKEGCHNNL